MIISCRENTRFLNQRLRQYDEFLALPPLIENVLYLAYTIEVRPHSPFRVDQLRQHLTQHGIETAAEFCFVAPSVDESHARSAGGDGEISNRFKSDKFCIPCHMGLTILDLRQIIAAFDSFFQTIKCDCSINGTSEIYDNDG